MSLFVIAHAVLRVRLPHADPYLLPLGGLLSALGLTMIYRIDPELAFRQGSGSSSASPSFAALVLFLRGLPRARQRQVHPRHLGHRPPRPAGRAPVHRADDQRRDALGRLRRRARLPARRAGEGPLRDLPGRLPARQPRAALLRRRRPGRLPSPKHLGPLLLIWGGAMLVLFQTRDLGGALLYFAIFLVMLYTATARWSFVAAGPRALPRRSLRALPGDPARPGPRAELARPLGGPGGVSYQLVQSLYAVSSGGVFGSGLGNGVLLTPEGDPYIPFLETDFIFSAIAQELGLAGARRRDPPLPHLRLPRLPHLHARAGRLLEAPRGRPDGRRRHPGVHHHRRRGRADPADRDHAAVRLLRGLEHRRQLRRARAPAHGLRPGQPGARE